MDTKTNPPEGVCGRPVPESSLELLYWTGQPEREADGERTGGRIRNHEEKEVQDGGRCEKKGKVSDQGPRHGTMLYIMDVPLVTLLPSYILCGYMQNRMESV